MAGTTNQANLEVRRRLTDALIQLTQEQELSAVSITELCLKADVSRMSFYRNFDSKEDVMRSHIVDVFDEYRELTSPFRDDGEACYGIGHLVTTFTFFRTHSPFIESLYACGHGSLFAESVTGYVLDTWGTGDRTWELRLTAFAGSLCSLYEPWAKSGFQESPLEMARLLNGIYAQ